MDAVIMNVIYIDRMGQIYTFTECHKTGGIFDIKHFPQQQY